MGIALTNKDEKFSVGVEYNKYEGVVLSTLWLRTGLKASRRPPAEINERRVSRS